MQNCAIHWSDDNYFVSKFIASFAAHYFNLSIFQLISSVNHFHLSIICVLLVFLLFIFISINFLSFQLFFILSIIMLFLLLFSLLSFSSLDLMILPVPFLFSISLFLKFFLDYSIRSFIIFDLSFFKKWSNLIKSNIIGFKLPYFYHLLTYHLHIMNYLGIGLINLDLFKEIKLKRFSYYYFNHQN
jgi:hypothetical protein